MMRLVGCLAVAILLVSCDGVYRITVTMPWCPVSDSARARADSIPVACLQPDTSKTR
jgi:hypothetical protein